MWMSLARWLVPALALLGIALPIRGAAVPLGGWGGAPALRLVRVLPSGGKTVRSIHFSADSSLLTTAEDLAITVWDVRTGKILRHTSLGREHTSFAYFAAGDRTLICSAGVDKRLFLLNPISLKARKTLDVPHSMRGSGALSGDRKLFAVGFQDTIRVFEAETGKLHSDLRLPDDEGICAVAFAADNQTLAVARGDPLVRVFNLETRKEVRALLPRVVPQNLRVVSLAWVLSGKVLAAGMTIPSAVYLWDVDRGELVREMRWGTPRHLRPKFEHPEKRPATGLRALAGSPDGKTLAAACCDGKLRLWEAVSGGLRHEANISAHYLAFSPDGLLLATCREPSGCVWLWDWRDRGCGRTPRLTRTTLDRLWDDLAGPDALVAYRAMAAMLRDPHAAVECLDGRLKRVEPVSPKELGRFMALLDDDEYEVRERASRRLASLGRVAEAELRAELRRKTTPEVRRRVKELLRRLETVDAQQLRVLRCIEVLERVGTRRARRVLERLASGAPGALETHDAREALARMAPQKSRKP